MTDATLAQLAGGEYHNDDGLRAVPHAPKGHRVFLMLRSSRTPDRFNGVVRCQCHHEGPLVDHSAHLADAARVAFGRDDLPARA